MLGIGRLSHIAEHYEREPLFATQWSISLVVRGLLKQCRPKFNVAKAWDELGGRAPNRDRQLIWSTKDAEALKRKLEFHEGTPQELAREAKKLAVMPYAPALQVWIDAEAKSTPSIDPALLKQTQRSKRDLSVSTSYELQDDMYNYI